jgi:hypothetical protein
MKRSRRLGRSLAGLCLAALPSLALAQRPHAASAERPAGSYDMAKDVALSGTVLSYTENSKTPPLGAHALVATASGNVDVHLGNARLLRQAKMALKPGQSIRVVGQSRTLGQGSVFLARLVQSGTQVVALRSDHGLPLTPAGPRGNKALLANLPAEQRGGAR